MIEFLKYVLRLGQVLAMNSFSRRRNDGELQTTQLVQVGDIGTNVGKPSYICFVGLN